MENLEYKLDLFFNNFMDTMNSYSIDNIKLFDKKFGNNITSVYLNSKKRVIGLVRIFHFDNGIDYEVKNEVLEINKKSLSHFLSVFNNTNYLDIKKVSYYSLLEYVFNNKIGINPYYNNN